MFSLLSIPYFGESLSLVVAMMWTTSALFSEVATKRLGASVVNVWRMVLSMSMIALLLFIFTGNPLPPATTSETWMWLLLSGATGYVFGDYCLFNAYHLIGSRFAQLFMTLSPATAAIAGWLFMGQTISLTGIVGMTITSLGIALSILGRGEKPKSTACPATSEVQSKSSETACESSETSGNPSEVSSQNSDVVAETSETTSRKRVTLRLPLRGVIYGIGAGVGQGLGLVFSAKGLAHYDASLQTLGLTPQQLDTYQMLLPFAATFVRGIAGLVGFVVILILARKVQRFTASLRDARGMSLLTCAVIFGPFVGVSLSLMATRHTSVGIGMTLMSLSPILILLPARFFFGQRITLQEIIGAIVSVVGVSIFFLS